MPIPNKYKVRGFTVVELLIVIVVIAILATISAVAYSGTQRRADGVAIAASAKQWYTLIGAYHAVESDKLVDLDIYCVPNLGRSTSEFSDLPGNQGCFSQPVMDKLISVHGANNIPSGRLPNIGSSFHGVKLDRTSYRLMFVQPGENTCPAWSENNLYTPSIDVTLCSVKLS